MPKTTEDTTKQKGKMGRPPKRHFKLSQLDKDRCLQKLQALWHEGEAQLKQLIIQISQEGPLDRDSVHVHLDRLRAARIPGFEGTKLFNLKLNKRLRAEGQEPIDLAKECPEELNKRHDDQYELYQKICFFYKGAAGNSNSTDIQQEMITARKQSVQREKFLIPQKAQKSVKICLQEAIPFLAVPTNNTGEGGTDQANMNVALRKRQVFLEHLKQKAIANIDLFYKDTIQKEHLSKLNEPPHHSDQVQTQQPSASEDRQRYASVQKQPMHPNSDNQNPQSNINNNTSVGIGPQSKSSHNNLQHQTQTQAQLGQLNSNSQHQQTYPSQHFQVQDSSKQRTREYSLQPKSSNQRIESEEHGNLRQAIAQVQKLADQIESPEQLDSSYLELLLHISQQSMHDLRSFKIKEERAVVQMLRERSRSGDYQAEYDIIEMLRNMATSPYKIIEILKNVQLTREQKHSEADKFFQQVHKEVRRERSRERERHMRSQHLARQSSHRYGTSGSSRY